METYDPAAFTLQFEQASFWRMTLCSDFEGNYQSVGDGIHTFMASMLGKADCGQVELIKGVIYFLFRLYRRLAYSLELLALSALALSLLEALFSDLLSLFSSPDFELPEPRPPPDGER